MAVYKNRPNAIQKSRDIGSFFSHLLKKAAPVHKTATKHVGKQLVSMGMHVVSDVVLGKNVGCFLNCRFKEMGAKLLGDAKEGLGSMAPLAQ